MWIKGILPSSLSLEAQIGFSNFLWEGKLEYALGHWIDDIDFSAAANVILPCHGENSVT